MMYSYQKVVCISSMNNLMLEKEQLYCVAYKINLTFFSSEHYTKMEGREKWKWRLTVALATDKETNFFLTELCCDTEKLLSLEKKLMEITMA